MLHQYFAANLRVVCDQHRSVAQVCRSLEMNRQQFNKYLSGQIYPSKHNLARICKFFKFSEDQMNIPSAEFEQVVFESSDLEVDIASSEIEKLIETLPDSNDVLSRYEGYYYSHFHALGFPGYLVRSMVCIYRHKNRYYSRNSEHLWDKEKNDSHRHRFKYKGVVLYLGDRIFIIEVEMLTKNAICQTILFPSYRNVVDTLSGITTGVGSVNSHMPKATRVEWEFLGKQVDVKETLRGCGLFSLDSELIDVEIRQRIDNELTDQKYMLTARDF
jgi:transcriptional regulator with XRE-family HTH domain